MEAGLYIYRERELVLPRHARFPAGRICVGLLLSRFVASFSQRCRRPLSLAQYPLSLDRQSHSQPSQACASKHPPSLLSSVESLLLLLQSQQRTLSLFHKGTNHCLCPDTPAVCTRPNPVPLSSSTCTSSQVTHSHTPHTKHREGARLSKSSQARQQRRS